MKKILTLDCEIVEQLKPGDLRWNKPSELTISCLGIQWQEEAGKISYCWIPDEGALYSDDGIHELCADEVQRYLDIADVVISFNGECFDFPLMQAAGFHMLHAKSVSYDLMAEFVEVAGHRISLDALAKSLVGRGKSGSGSLAPQLWKGATVLRKLAGYAVDIGEIIEDDWQESDLEQGAKFLYQSVINYCLDDVALTREVFDRLVDWNGEVTYLNLMDKTDRMVMLELPDGFGLSPPVRELMDVPRVGDWFLVASSGADVISMIPKSAQGYQISDWRVRHRGCQILEELVDDDKIILDFVDIPF